MTKTGVFDGKCEEYCGTNHDRMLFSVKAVIPQQYDQFVKNRSSRLGAASDAHRADPHARPQQVHVSPAARWSSGSSALTTRSSATCTSRRRSSSSCSVGVIALMMRTELAIPGLQFMSNEQYNQLFTNHGAIMLLLFATPTIIGFSNVIMPLQIGAPDVAFPRLNLLSFYLFVYGGLIVASGFLTANGGADFGWFAYAPLDSKVFSPNIGNDLWIMGLIVSGFSTILGAVNFLTTLFTMRGPGMTMFRMPVFLLGHAEDIDPGAATHNRH